MRRGLRFFTLQHGVRSSQRPKPMETRTKMPFGSRGARRLSGLYRSATCAGCGAVSRIQREWHCGLTRRTAAETRPDRGRRGNILQASAKQPGASFPGLLQVRPNGCVAAFEKFPMDGLPQAIYSYHW